MNKIRVAAVTACALLGLAACQPAPHPPGGGPSRSIAFLPSSAATLTEAVEHPPSASPAAASAGAAYRGKAGATARLVFVPAAFQAGDPAATTSVTASGTRGAIATVRVGSTAAVALTVSNAADPVADATAIAATIRSRRLGLDHGSPPPAALAGYARVAWQLGGTSPTSRSTWFVQRYQLASGVDVVLRSAGMTPATTPLDLAAIPLDEPVSVHGGLPMVVQPGSRYSPSVVVFVARGTWVSLTASVPAPELISLAQAVTFGGRAEWDAALAGL